MGAIQHDLFSVKKRATAFGIFAMGIPIGVLLGFVIGGWVNHYLGWRWAFFVAGAPGLLLALVVLFTVTEPQRQRLNQNDKAYSLVEVLKYLRHSKLFLHIAAGGSLTAFVGYGIFAWMPSLLIRFHGLDTAQAGTWLGLILGIPGGIGILAGGILADRWGGQDARWYLWIVTLALLIATPFLIGVYLSSSAVACLAFLTVPVLLGNFYQATTFAHAPHTTQIRSSAATRRARSMVASRSV